MELKPKYGIDKLIFGMKQKDVTAVYGEPDKRFKDDEKNIIYVYDIPKLRLTFYEDEEMMLGYIISANPHLEFFGKKIVGRTVAEVKEEFQNNGIKSWEKEDFDLAENHFNEENWLVLQSEFGTIAKVELGAIINAKDEFEWKFKSK
ncbi:MAG TPA: hypothetical protein VF581_01805 [Flavobacterium sp.]|jgi:hypothetical protein